MSGFRSALRWPRGVPVPRAEGISAVCEQCGRPDADILDVTRRTVRRSCRVCGAVITSLRPPDTAIGPEPADADPLTAFMPAGMARWLRERDPDEDLPAEPDKETLTRWYTAFDASAEPDHGRPPKFAKVLGTLNGTCFDAEHAVRRLLTASAEEEAVRERVGHALTWLATPAGRGSTWLAAPAAEPDPAEVTALLEMDDLALAARQGYSQTVRAALFNVKKGPSADDIIAQFGEDAVRAALLAFADGGSRPLLDAVRARLDPSQSGRGVH